MVAEFSIKNNTPAIIQNRDCSAGFVFIIPEKVNQPEATGDNHKAANQFLM